MSIIFHEKSRQFHLFNSEVSYIIGVLPNGEMGHLYYGAKIHDRDDFSYLQEEHPRAQLVTTHDSYSFSMELARCEYPSFGTNDYREPAFMINYENGSHVSHFVYDSYEIYQGKRPIAGLPTCYVEDEQEADSLVVTLIDPLTAATLELHYSIYRDYPVVTRSVTFVNSGTEKISLERVLSLSIDYPDHNYKWVQFSGAWGRERRRIEKDLDEGRVNIGSMRGHSSAKHNPFVILRRPETSEMQGEAYGFSFVYSGNFMAQAEVDTYGMMRMTMGINPECFSWPLNPGEKFDSPEVVCCYSNKGLNYLSQSYHKLYRNRLSRGEWKTKERPILLNNWEATMMDFDEEAILKIASKGKEAGVELFVLDDGWFGTRNDDHSGLGDWWPNLDKLPDGISGLAKKVNDIGLDFGFWIEPEMVNEDSDLYRAHPDWVLAVPGREKSLGRNQMVLDFSKPEVVDYIYNMLYKVISTANIAYIKWDMNRSISECYSIGGDPSEQGTVYHKYILGVYSLYERLIAAFPHILFESCSSGGCRFDAGMLYYAPQAWCSDDTDAGERISIQYGTSYGYPISSIGAHVSAVPNQQSGRVISIDTRADVACFGTFGYELDLNELEDAEFEKVKEQVKFMKKYRALLQGGDFYRLKSPYNSDEAAWMVVSPDKSEAIVAHYILYNKVNDGIRRLRLAGLLGDREYEIEGNLFYGDELMNVGMVTSQPPFFGPSGDFRSKIYILKAK